VLANHDSTDSVSTGRGSRRSAVTYRRSPHLVSFWRRGSFVIFNYATRQTATADPLVLQVLNACDRWQTLEQIRRHLPSEPPAVVGVLVGRLLELGLFERGDRPPDPRVLAMDGLGNWNPEVGFFHMASRDVPFSSPQQVSRRARLADRDRMPPATKRYPGSETIALPRPQGTSEFPQVLKARRTWRRYSASPVTLDELATLLGFSAGVQSWVGTGRLRSPLKTSPSGGARHSIECYVVSRNVAGLKPGVYHYAGHTHTLEKLRGAVPRKRMKAYLPHSAYFASASAMVFFTAVFERILWRYPYSRAYRAALVEAGHVCQTFCLTATWQRLAPYCVMGLADTLIEQDLGIDGISESVLYAAGVGRPPRGSTWAALPRGPNPIVRRNARL
jgi:SagB-type dehydrogenase family enzyme